MRRTLKDFMSHAPLSNLILHCADGRLLQDIYDWLTSKGFVGTCDKLVYPGGCQRLVMPKNEAQRECALDDIETLIGLHGTQRIILANHTDCGAYGGAAAFHNPEAERQKHAEHLKEAASIIKSRWPAMEVVIVVIEMTSLGNNFIEIE
ncbi:MAG: carbonic anhydrase [bacterium]